MHLFAFLLWVLVREWNTHTHTISSCNDQIGLIAHVVALSSSNKRLDLLLLPLIQVLLTCSNSPLPYERVVAEQLPPLIGWEVRKQLPGDVSQGQKYPCQLVTKWETEGGGGRGGGRIVTNSMVTWHIVLSFRFLPRSDRTDSRTLCAQHTGYTNT